MSNTTQQIRTHGILGIVWGCLFCTSTILTVANLSNLSRHHNDTTGAYRSREHITIRYRGRRKYYVVLLTGIVGSVVSFLAIDVDRDPAPALNFKLQCIFYTVLQPLLLLSTFEAVRYWIWCVRRGDGIDVRDVHYVAKGTGSTFTILFYVVDAAALVLCIARNWDSLIKQSATTEETGRGAKDVVMDGRFRAGQVLMSLCFTNILVRLVQGWLRYNRSRQGAQGELLADSISTSVAAFLCGLSVGYNLISSHIWRISPYNLTMSQSYYWGYGINPVWMTLIIINITGLAGARSGSKMRRRLRKVSLRKPDWWNMSKVGVADNTASPLDFHLLKHVRGREEKYESRSSWWWQAEDSQTNHDEQGNCEQESQWHQLDKMPRDPDWPEGPNQEGVKSSSSPSGSRQRSQQRQGLPVKSMLEI